MGIKRLFFSIAALVAAMTTTSVSAADMELSDWTIGGKINVYSRWNGTVGVGAYGRYSFDNGLRIEPQVLFLCEKGMSIDIAADVQYPFALADSFEVYPLAGISLNDPGKFGVGINLGGGVGYALSQRVNVDFGVKWILQTQKYVTNPIVFSLGAGYKF